LKASSDIAMDAMTPPESMIRSLAVAIECRALACFATDMPPESVAANASAVAASSYWCWCWQCYRTGEVRNSTEYGRSKTRVSAAVALRALQLAWHEPPRDINRINMWRHCTKPEQCSPGGS
jgi:hypothetical protein